MPTPGQHQKKKKKKKKKKNLKKKKLPKDASLADSHALSCILQLTSVANNQ